MRRSASARRRAGCCHQGRKMRRKMGSVPDFRKMGSVPFFVGALACALLLGFGYYLQYARGLEPCPLCLVQRGFFYATGGIFLIAGLHSPGRAGSVAYLILAFLFAASGAATGARQVWLQHLPPHMVPPCGPDPVFMLENFPLSQT